MKGFRASLLAFLLLAAVLLAAGCARRGGMSPQAAGLANDVPDPAQVRAIAEEGFVYGLPIVMNYGVMYENAVDRDSGQYKAPFNELYNEARVFTYKDTTVVTPNSDTPYSFAFMDLRAEPMVVSVPAVEKRRYYSVQLVDGNTFNYGYIGSRTTGNGPGDYLVVGPEWKGEVPAGIKRVFTSSTQFTMGLFRTQLFDAKDMPHVVKVQAGYKVRPLSAYLRRPAPAALPLPAFPKIDKELVKVEFFEYLDFALQFAPAGPEEVAIRQRLARIGVGPGKTFDFKALPPAQKEAALRGLQDGEAKIARAVDDVGRNINGWRLASAFGDRAFYHGDWGKRAGAAKAGIYGNDAAEAVYPMAKFLADGEPLDGGRHDYAITFPAGQLPPVNAFWSLTMYDGKTQLLVENPIGRYLVNSPMLPGLRRNPDGSLTIYIQKDAPAKDKAANWLPAPDGPIYLVMRLYWPKTEAPSVLPVGAGTWQPPAIVKTR
ncbi:DUF1254 domain-containing protein [Solidesulfovibrio sp.]|uniref:DUF1254 domain-containing protein n=1 Tax=Solidesulfovibrio sp. TaxID=2910990 RepID=UPI0026036DF5|nr:DUF1254 domain-containing protein [Solidesulfovibrio sp.]